jgi:hypothetical protein
MCNPSSSFASICLLHPSPIILLIIFTTKVVKFWIYIHVQSIIFFCIYLHFTSTHPHHHIHSIYWHTKVAKFWICIHVQFIIFLLHLSIFHIPHHHIHSIHKQTKGTKFECAFMGNPSCSFPSIYF